MWGMRMVNIIHTRSKESVANSASEKLIGAISALAREKEHVTIALCGGRNVQGIFEQMLKAKRVNWKKVHLFVVDERLVEITDEESNFLLMKKFLIDPLIVRGDLPKENAHPFIYEPARPDKGVIAYERELHKYGGRFDIVLLSAGEDGHIAGLYPNHHSVADESNYFLTMTDSPKPPKERMTTSRRLLLHSKVAILLFVGDAKREAYNKFRDMTVHHFDCPAKLVNGITESFVITDLK
jgi:6-phosphogluconolactonase